MALQAPPQIMLVSGALADNAAGALVDAPWPIARVDVGQALGRALDEQRWDAILASADSLAAIRRRLGTVESGAALIGLLDGPDRALRAMQDGADAVLAPPFVAAQLEQCITQQLIAKAQRQRHRHCEQLLRETTECLHMTLEATEQAIAYVHQGRYLYANRAYLALLGAEDFAGLGDAGFLGHVDPAEYHRLAGYFDAYLHGERGRQELELRLRRIDGTSLATRVAFFPARYQGHACLQLSVVGESAITELRQRLVQQGDALAAEVARAGQFAARVTDLEAENRNLDTHIADLEERLQGRVPREQFDALQCRLDETMEQQQHLLQELDSAREAMAGADQREASLRQQVRGLEQSLLERSQQFERRELQLSTLRNSLRERRQVLETELAAHGKTREMAAQQVQRLQVVEAELGDLEQRLESALGARDAAQRAVEESQADARRSAQERLARDRQLQSLRASMRGQWQEVRALHAQLETARVLEKELQGQLATTVGQLQTRETQLQAVRDASRRTWTQSRREQARVAGLLREREQLQDELGQFKERLQELLPWRDQAAQLAERNSHLESEVQRGVVEQAQLRGRYLQMLEQWQAREEADNQLHERQLALEAAVERLERELLLKNRTISQVASRFRRLRQLGLLSGEPGTGNGRTKAG